MIGKAVKHMFETEDGSKDEWRVMELACTLRMYTWFYITSKKDSVLYMYQPLEVDVPIMPDSNDLPSEKREPGKVVESLVSKKVKYAEEDGSKNVGMVTHQGEAKLSSSFIKFDDDFYI